MFNVMVFVRSPFGLEPWVSGRRILSEPLGKGSALDVAEDGLELISKFFGVQSFRGHEGSELGRVADGFVHGGGALGVQQVHNLFEFMDALDVGDFIGVASALQGLK